MRLRPSGRSGPPAVKWSQFVEHHEIRARTWEHLALSTARFIRGDAALGTKAEAFIKDRLARPRDLEQARTDAARMWSRIADQRIRQTPHRLFDARLREGGLLEAEFVFNSLRLLGRDTHVLTQPLRYFSDQLIWERLLSLTGQADVPDRFAPDVPQGKTGILSHHVRAQTEILFSDCDISGEDQPIRWI